MKINEVNSEDSETWEGLETPHSFLHLLKNNYIIFLSLLWDLGELQVGIMT